jgi:predicted O-linked N-acetylglucosamine transferase (SPINDLY family)
MLELNQKDEKLLSELVEKYKAYRKPTEKQQLLVALSEIKNKTEDDIKKLQLLLNAERKAKQYFEADKAVNEALKVEKEKARKLLEHKKFTLGGGLWSALKDNKMFNGAISYRDILEMMIHQGLIHPIDKQGVNLFAEFLPTANETTNAPSQPSLPLSNSTNNS